MTKTVMAFGSFDGIHLGHIHYLEESKKYGKLIVAIGRDKSPWKPLAGFGLPEQERAKLVEWLGIADKVILGSVKNPLEKIKEINPDYITLTKYNPVDSAILQSDLKRLGLKTKVILIKLHNQKVYDGYFNKVTRNILGLPRIKLIK